MSPLTILWNTRPYWPNFEGMLPKPQVHLSNMKITETALNFPNIYGKNHNTQYSINRSSSTEHHYSSTISKCCNLHITEKFHTIYQTIKAILHLYSLAMCLTQNASYSWLIWIQHRNTSENNDERGFTYSLDSRDPKIRLSRTSMTEPEKLPPHKEKWRLTMFAGIYPLPFTAWLWRSHVEKLAGRSEDIRRVCGMKNNVRIIFKSGITLRSQLSRSNKLLMWYFTFYYTPTFARDYKPLTSFVNWVTWFFYVNSYLCGSILGQ